MKKLKSSEPRDRLSELSDSVIFDIFQLLPTTDVVRTTVLSRRWRNLWTTSPNLNFGDNYLNFGDNYGINCSDKFRNFVNRVLLRWRGARVHKFSVSCPFKPKSSLVADLDLWLHFAIDNGVECLYISNHPTFAPRCVYTCSTLRKLRLNRCNLKINGNLEWNHLNYLSITLGFEMMMTQDVIEKILRGSPLLEVFNLSLAQRAENLNLSFRSTSLKELFIFKSIVGEVVESECAELRIWAPNLETLSIVGDSYTKYLLEDVSSITRATLEFHCGNWESRAPLLDILPSIRHVERLTLLGWHIKMVGTEKILMLLDDSISPLSNLKFLNLTSRREEFKNMVHLLAIFPNIKTLVLRVDGNAQSSVEFKPDYPSKPLVTELRTVEVTWIDDDFSIFPLIEMLLKCASKLEKMVFRVKGFKELPPPPSNSLLLASQKLLGMQRSYPNAEFVLCEY